MRKTVMLIEHDRHELDRMKNAIKELDSAVHCMSFEYAREVVPAIKHELKQVPDYIFLDVDIPRKRVNELLAGLYALKASRNAKIAVFAPVMPKRVAYTYRVLGANYAFQKPTTSAGYREIFARILDKENE